MIRPSAHLLRGGIAKAEQAYGEVVVRDIVKAMDELQTQRDWLDRCMKAMAINIPKALLWDRILALKRTFGRL